MAHLPATDLHVTVWGEGEAVVLVHGSFTYKDPPEDDWREQRALASRCRLIMPVRRGYATSPERPSAYGFDEELEEIAALLSDGAHLVGHSYGGVLSLLAAARRPDVVWSLAVIEPPAFGVARGNQEVDSLATRMEAVYAAATHTTPEEFVLSFRRGLRGLAPNDPLELTEEDRAVLATPMGRRGVEATMREEFTGYAKISLDSLAEAPFPKLVFSGGWSLALDAICDVLEQRLPAQRAIITGAGHPVQLTGKPFNDRLAAFLASAGRR